MKYNIIIAILLAGMFITGSSKALHLQNNSEFGDRNMDSSNNISKTNVSEDYGQLSAGELVFIGELDKSICPIDNNGKFCAHIIVEISLPDVGFESDMILKSTNGNDIETTSGQYSFWVSTSGNTKKKSISIAHSNYYSTVIPLSCNGKSLAPQGEYRVKVNTPAPKGTVIFYSEYTNDYSLFIDGDLFEPADNGMISISLPAGVYTYMVQSEGREDITESITIIAGNIIEKQLVLVPSNRSSLDYVKYRIGELYKNKSNRLSYATSTLSELYNNCREILKEFPSLLENSEFMWFINDADRKKYNLIIEQIDFNNNSMATAKIKLERSDKFADGSTLHLIMKNIHNDWYLEDILKEDKYFGENENNSSAQRAFLGTIEKYNQWKANEHEPSKVVNDVLKAIIDVISVDEEYEEKNLQDVLTLKKFNKPISSEDVEFHWTLNCSAKDIRGHIVPMDYNKESIFIYEGAYRIQPWCIITVWEKENIEIMDELLSQHKWVKKGKNWVRKAPINSYENDKYLTIKLNTLYGENAYTIFVTQYSEDSLEYMESEQL